MKVGNFYPVMFRSSIHVTRSDSNTIQHPEIKEQQFVAPYKPVEKNITNPFHPTLPSYNVRIPQKYQELGVTEFSNGQKIHSYKRANRL